eukprot:TRINITY_DN10626_c0_g1_i3.p2 TRINITY_DN10626_c0_g1~~TRINITY_DN10626_c0_g1_i3.p2  ORF type:complete len:136 (-),score=11.28 TRINITY_DN10626_c0_g1_i3:73-480(-)
MCVDERRSSKAPDSAEWFSHQKVLERTIMQCEHNALTAKHLVLSGAALLLAGLIWGSQIHAAPNPRIALSAHLKMTSEGVMTVVGGLLMANPQMCRLGRKAASFVPVSYTHLRAHETVLDLVCRLLLEKKKKDKK